MQPGSIDIVGLSVIRTLAAFTLAAFLVGCKAQDDQWVEKSLITFNDTFYKGKPSVKWIATIKSVDQRFKQAGDDAAPALVRILNDPQKENLYSIAIIFLLRTNVPEANGIARRFLANKDRYIHISVRNGLMAKPRPSLRNDIISAVNTRSMSVGEAAQIFCAWRDKSAAPFLREQLDRCAVDQKEQFNATKLMESLSLIGDKGSVPAIRRFENAPDFRTQVSAVEALHMLHADIEPQGVITRAKAILADKTSDVVDQILAAGLLVALEDPSAEEICITFAKSSDASLREYSADVLVDFTSAETRKALEALAKDKEPVIKEIANASLHGKNH